MAKKNKYAYDDYEDEEYDFRPSQTNYDRRRDKKIRNALRSKNVSDLIEDFDDDDFDY